VVLVVRPLVDELVGPKPRQAQERDLPLAADAPVFVFVVAVPEQAVRLGPVGSIPLEVVDHRPDPACSVGAGEANLGHVTVVNRRHLLQARAQVADPLVRVVPDSRRFESAIVREEQSPFVPLLRVHVPEVPRLQLLDRLEVDQLVQCVGTHRASTPRGSRDGTRAPGSGNSIVRATSASIRSSSSAGVLSRTPKAHISRIVSNSQPTHAV
jgi:hypothetical protein